MPNEERRTKNEERNEERRKEEPRVDDNYREFGEIREAFDGPPQAARRMLRTASRSSQIS
jgi:hypothetical protein